MGHKFSQDQYSHLLQLQGLIQAAGCKVPHTKWLAEFLLPVQEQCPWYPKEYIGCWLRQSLGPVTVQHLTLWNSCSLALRPIQSKEKLFLSPRRFITSSSSSSSSTADSQQMSIK